MEAATKYLGQKVIPVNKAGAGGTIAATAVMNSKPDGYILGVVSYFGCFYGPLCGGHAL